jgi:hypothetical protein
MVDKKRIWTPQDLLDFWQECHGELNTYWQRVFLRDSRVRRLCEGEIGESLLVAIRRNKKLDDVFLDLERQSQKHLEFEKKLNPWKDSIPEPSGIEPQKFNGWYRWGGRWRKGF